MKFFNCKACGIVLFLLAIANGQSQDSSGERLRDCVNKFAESRGGVANYCVRLQRLIYSPKVVIGNGESAPMFDLSLSKIEIAADCLSDRILIINSSYAPFSSEAGLAAQDIYCVIGKHFWRLTSNGFEDFRASNAPVPDPLSLGGGLFPETTRYHNLEGVVSALNAWHSGPARLSFDIQQKGALLALQNGNRYFVFDTSRDYQITETGSGAVDTRFMKEAGGVEIRDTRVTGSVTPVLVRGIWLPGTVSYINGESDFLQMNLDWVSVNQPIPDCVFDRQSLEAFFLNDEPLQPEASATSEGNSGTAIPYIAAPIANRMDTLFAPARFPSIQLGLLLLEPSIHTELRISEEVQTNVENALKQLRQHAPSITSLRNELPEKRFGLFQSLIKHAEEEDHKLWNVLEELLPPLNMDRVMGAYLMMHGLSGVLNEHIAERLLLDDEQKKIIQRAIESVQSKKRQALTLLASGKLEGGDMPLAQPNRAVESAIIRLAMTPKQLGELDKLLENSKLKVPLLRFTFGW